MMRSISLDSLLGPDFPEASFHDAALIGFQADYARHRAEFRFRVVTDVVDGEPQMVPAELVFTGLQFLALEAPATASHEWRDDHRWITSNGPFPDPRVKTSLKVPNDLPAEAFCHYFFASDTNSFILVAATEVKFCWKSGAAG